MDGYYEKYQYLSCFQMVEDKKYWWLPEYKWNVLFRISKTTLEIEQVVNFEEKVLVSEGAYSYIVLWKDIIIFLPQNSLKVGIFNTKSNKLITLCLKTGGERKSYGTAGYVLLGKSVYVFSSYEECLPFVLDAETLSIRYLKSWLKEIKKYSIGEKWFINSVVEIDKEIFFGLYNNNIILKYDPIKDIYENIPILNEYYKINKIYKDVNQSKLIILPNTDIGILEIKLERETIHVKQYKVSKMGESNVINILVDSDELILLPKRGRNVEIIHREKERSILLDIPKDFFVKSGGLSLCTSYFGEIYGELIYLFPFSTKGIISVNKITKNMELIELRIKKNQSLKELFDLYIFQNPKKVYREQIVSLNTFFYICNQNISERNISNLSIGDKIFKRMLEG